MVTSFALSLALLALACGDKAPPLPAACSAFGIAFKGEGGNAHVADCASTQCGNGENPPTAGAHCPQTLACHGYDAAQQRCRWIHNLEHGHLVLAYNCPTGCPDVVAALEKIRAAAPDRRILTPDPALPKRVAAVVWGYAYSSDDVNTAAIDCVIGQQDQAAPEPGLACSH